MTTLKRVIGIASIVVAWTSYLVFILPSATKLNSDWVYVFTGVVAALMGFSTVEVLLALMDSDTPLPPQRRRTDQPPEYDD